MAENATARLRGIVALGNAFEATPTALGRHSDAAIPARVRNAINCVDVLVSPAPTALHAWSNAPTRHTRLQPARSATVAHKRSEQPQDKAKADAGHSSRPGGMARSCAITGMQTVRRPARRLLIPVIHVIQAMMAALRRLDGACVDAGVGTVAVAECSVVGVNSREEARKSSIASNAIGGAGCIHVLAKVIK